MDKESNNKKGFPVTYLICILLGLLAVGCIVGFFLSNNGDNNDKDKESKMEEDSSYVVIDMGNDTDQLYDMVHPVHDYERINKIEYTSKGMTKDQMTPLYKSLLASNIFRNYDNINQKGFFAPEDDVKNAYETIFGEGSYTSGMDIPEWEYSKEEKVYYDKTTYVPSNVEVFDRVFEAKENETNLKLTSVVLFCNRDDNNCYKEYELKNEVGNFGDVYGNHDELYNYMMVYKDDLQQYTYTFEKTGNETNPYKYVEFKRTNE